MEARIREKDRQMVSVAFCALTEARTQIGTF
jgi:hypothetical protein